MFYFLRPLQKTSQPFLSNIFLSLAQHASAPALVTCDIQLMSKQAKINVKIVRTDKLYNWKKLSKLKKSVFLYFFALMLDNLHLYLGGQVVIVTFLKLLHRICFYLFMLEDQ